MVSSVAVLIFLAASARAGIVTTYSLFSTDRFAFLLFTSILCGCCLLVRIVQIFFLLPVLTHVLTLFGGSLAYFYVLLRSLLLCRLLCRLCILRLLRLLRLCRSFLYRDLSTHQDGNSFVIDLVDHIVEQIN